MSLKYNFFPIYLILLSIYGYNINNKFKTYTNYINDSKYSIILWPIMLTGTWFLKDKVIKKKKLIKIYNILVIGLVFEFIKKLKVIHNLSAIIIFVFISYKFLKIENKTKLQKVLSYNIIFYTITSLLNTFIRNIISIKILEKLDKKEMLGIIQQLWLISLSIFNITFKDNRHKKLKSNNLDKNIINNTLSIINIIGKKNTKKILKI